eukprot:CCRYP_020924-RA/>CCRYP_020924-RA protein AED:0.25 eAED:0.25 QI:720/1/1/1/0/0/4/3187/122
MNSSFEEVRDVRDFMPTLLCWLKLQHGNNLTFVFLIVTWKRHEKFFLSVLSSYNFHLNGQNTSFDDPKEEWRFPPVMTYTIRLIGASFLQPYEQQPNPPPWPFRQHHDAEMPRPLLPLPSSF